MPHEIPTHLEVADKLVFGLTARQALVIGLGLCLGYVGFQQTHLTLSALGDWSLPLPLRMGSGLLPVAGGVLLAWFHPLDRPLEVWVLVWLRYQTMPKIYLWHPVMSQVGDADEELIALLTVNTSEAVMESPRMPSRWAGLFTPTYQEVSDGR